MQFILKISPPVLRRLDTYLRVNHAWIWMTKIHLHLYLSLILSAFFALIGLVYNIGITQVPSLGDQDTFFGLLFIPATLFGFFIVYNMSLFNPDKSAGYRFKYQEFFILIIYFFSFSLPLLIPYPASIILNKRIADLVEDVEFNRDEDNFNKGLPFFPQAANAGSYHFYPSDSIYLSETNNDRTDNLYDDNYYSGYQTLLREWSKLTDSIYGHKGVFENQRPKLYYINRLTWDNDFYSYGRYGKGLSLNYNDSLFRLYLNDINVVRDPKVAKRQIAAAVSLLNKYDHTRAIDQAKILNNYLNHSYVPGMQTDLYDPYDIFKKAENNITAIHFAKINRVGSRDSDFLHGILTFVFCLTLIFQIFKNVHWKQFLLGLSISIALVSLIALIEVVCDYDGNFVSLMSLLIPLSFILASIKGFFITRYSWILNQVNIMLSLCLAFYPLLILVYLVECHNIFEISYFDKYLEWSNGTQRYNSDYYELVRNIWSFAFWFGILSFVFIWNSYLKVLYLRYWSLPKRK